MSEKIDWSKAPEGYPLWITDDGGMINPCWHKEEADKYVDIRGCFWSKWSGGFTVHTRPTTPSWSGEGLPPVGTVLDAIDKEINGGTWSRMVVLAVGKHGQDDCLMVAEVIEGQSRPGKMVASLYTGWERSFRPILTQDQITTDEREEFARNLTLEMGKDSEYSPNAMSQARKMYDLGYRKP